MGFRCYGSGFSVQGSNGNLFEGSLLPAWESLQTMLLGALVENLPGNIRRTEGSALRV